MRFGPGAPDRDAVEAALSDVFLLGTEEQVRLAGTGRPRPEVAGRPVYTAELVTSLRDFIRRTGSRPGTR